MDAVTGSPEFDHDDPSDQISAILNYCSASLFSVVALVSALHLTYLIAIASRKGVRSIPYHVGLTFLVLFMCVSKALYFFYDPYGLYGRLHRLLALFLSGSNLTCLTSAFYFLALALVRMTQMKLLGKHIVSPLTITLTVICNFSVPLVTDVIVYHYSHLVYLYTVCVAYFVVWGLLYCSAYVIIVVRMHRAISETRKQLQEINTEEISTVGKDGKNKKMERNNPAISNTSKKTAVSTPRQSTSPTKVPRVIKIAAIIAVMMLAQALITMWALTYSLMGYNSPMVVMVSRFLRRLVEIFMGGIIIYVSALPVYRKT